MGRPVLYVTYELLKNPLLKENLGHEIFVVYLYKPKYCFNIDRTLQIISMDYLMLKGLDQPSVFVPYQLINVWNQLW